MFLLQIMGWISAFLGVTGILLGLGLLTWADLHESFRGRPDLRKRLSEVTDGLTLGLGIALLSIVGALLHYLGWLHMPKDEIVIIGVVYALLIPVALVVAFRSFVATIRFLRTLPNLDQKASPDSCSAP